MRRFMLVTLVAMLATPGFAAEDLGFTPEDEGLMVGCREDVAARSENGEETDLTECIGAASGPCMETPDGGTTIGMSDCLTRETAWWDAELNLHYETLADTLDPAVFETLQTAQRSWIDFREADCTFNYEYWAEGTIRSIYYGSCMLDRTARRALELEGYTDWE